MANKYEILVRRRVNRHGRRRNGMDALFGAARRHPLRPHRQRKKVTEDIYKTAGDVFEAARTRRSIRAYQPDPVPPETLREIVAARQVSRRHG